MKFVEKPNLPQNKVTTVIADDSDPLVHKKFCELKIKVISINECDKLDFPVSKHADMIVSHLKNNKILIINSEKYLLENLEKLGFDVDEIDEEISPKYPNDIKLNCCQINNFAICKEENTSKKLLEFLKNENIKIINTKQGYSKCSTLVVGENAVVTADDSIYKACLENEIDVLKIFAGNIKLDGYDYGFIGGCGGLIDKNLILFTGDINLHPDAKEIIQFLNKHNVDFISCEGALKDIGGIIPVLEIDS